MYPDKESSILLNKHFGCARWLNNYGLFGMCLNRNAFLISDKGITD
ncbi:MAG: helix-turn-helix domain-containing protein [Bacteroidales bacterium]